ncbi:hypothetical protein NDU88_001305 [Pleurodeles waltl]|uniref:Uncharacterized protein n=1 Tax=Pleurodeles waltl TaxID=8319 RepID=A0AAV7KP96_PLEWA|nr:hypothetical protein NDU88_001305 [Pleurodeles waltl]
MDADKGAPRAAAAVPRVKPKLGRTSAASTPVCARRDERRPQEEPQLHSFSRNPVEGWVAASPQQTCFCLEEMECAQESGIKGNCVNRQ